jgi:hypothetical protein
VTPTLQLSPEFKKQQIAIPNPEEVSAYLGQHCDLADLLPALCARARNEFGFEAELSLEIYQDPEIEDHYLTLYVRQPAYEEKIIERIEAASYEEDLADKTGWLLLTTDFGPPRSKHGV